LLRKRRTESRPNPWSVKEVELDAEMIVIGSCGKADDMNTIFFGSTAEKILRFITRPVLCVPPETEYKGVS